MISLAYYILKVIICSGVLFLYYHVALRNKLFHQWNRFYLLISVVISLIAPVIQVTIMHQISAEPNKAIQMLQVLQTADGYLEEVTITGQQGFSFLQMGMLVYILVSIVLFFSVLFSLRKIVSILRSHSVQLIEQIKFVNTNAQGTPFSFFNFIFWNESIDLQTETGQQIFEHELVHVKEKHTVDKLIIQFILIVFWCNPFFWLIRKELKLIHEFIADKKAVGEHGAAALAAMILNSSYPAQFNSITNQFFQTSIKRRLVMLTKIQNPKINYMSRLFALPILAITVLAFTLRTKTENASFLKLDRQVTVIIDAGHGLNADGTHSGVEVGNVYEDEITLAIAKKIQKLNMSREIKIVLTRNSDEIIDLKNRVEIAKANSANLFISLHVNSADRTQDPALSSSESLNKGMEIYVSGKQPVYQKQSEVFGSVLQQELNAIYPTNPYLLTRKVGIWVLDKNVCPSVLIECGFLTDQKDREFISKENNQTVIAQKILKAIERYALSQQQTQITISDTVPENKKATNTNDNSLINKNGNGIIAKSGVPVQPIYILDGKEASKWELDKIDPNSIQSINIFKDKTAIDKYGKRGENGVVEIKLKRTSSNADLNFNQNENPDATGAMNRNLSTNEANLTINATNNISIDTVPGNEPLFTKVETEASIDKAEWTAFLRKNLQPVIEHAASIGMKPGTYIVKLKFIVKQDGSITNIKALNDPGYQLAEKTVEFMKDSPKWNPGLQNGRPVNSFHTQPVTFVIQEQ